MSHQIKMTMKMKVENKKELIEALQECYPNAEVLENANLNIYGGNETEIVVRRKGHRDFGFNTAEDGESYEYVGYNPMYNDRAAIRENMAEVYDYYHPKVLEKQLASTGQSYVFSELKKKNGKTKMTINGSTDGGYV